MYVLCAPSGYNVLFMFNGLIKYNFRVHENLGFVSELFISKHCRFDMSGGDLDMRLTEDFSI